MHIRITMWTSFSMPSKLFWSQFQLFCSIKITFGLRNAVNVIDYLFVLFFSFWYKNVFQFIIVMTSHIWRLKKKQIRECLYIYKTFQILFINRIWGHMIDWVTYILRITTTIVYTKNPYSVVEKMVANCFFKNNKTKNTVKVT